MSDRWAAVVSDSASRELAARVRIPGAPRGEPLELGIGCITKRAWPCGRGAVTDAEAQRPDESGFIPRRRIRCGDWTSSPTSWRMDDAFEP